MVENHRKVLLSVSPLVLVCKLWHEHVMNGGHLGFGQYGAHGGSPAWLPRRIKSMWPGLQVVQIWCLWNDLNNYMIKPPDYSGFTNWCSSIRSVLELTGLDQAWETQHVANTNKSMLSFKDLFVGIFTERWRQYIDRSSKFFERYWRTLLRPQKIVVCSGIIQHLISGCVTPLSFLFHSFHQCLYSAYKSKSTQLLELSWTKL